MLILKGHPHPRQMMFHFRGRPGIFHLGHRQLKKKVMRRINIFVIPPPLTRRYLISENVFFSGRPLIINGFSGSNTIYKKLHKVRLAEGKVLELFISIWNESAMITGKCPFLDHPFYLLPLAKIFHPVWDWPLIGGNNPYSQ